MSKNCIFLLADGARADVFSSLLDEGRLPNISRYIVEPGAYTVATTVFPSTTGPAYAPFLAGRYPGMCNMPGLRWLDRERYEGETFSLRRMRSYVGIEAFLLNGDIDRDSKTLFELIPGTANLMNEFSRGAGFRGNKTKFWSAYHKFKAHYDHSWDKVDRFSSDILIKSLAERPQFVYYVFSAIDHFSHLHHPFHEKVIDGYLKVDDTVGRVVEELRAGGDLEDTMIIISSDHGLSPTHTHFDSVEFMERRGYKTLYYPNVLKRWRNATAANMVSGNSMAHLYVKSPSGWGTKTTFAEVEDLVDGLLERREVDIVAGLDSSGRTRIRSERGEALAWFDGNGSVHYEPVESDPFGYGDMPGKMGHYDALERTAETLYPDAIEQLVQVFTSGRCGDLVVSAHEGFDLRARHEHPEHKASHGAITRDHMMVPFAISVPIAREFVRTVDVFPTVLEHLGIGHDGPTEGVSLL